MRELLHYLLERNPFHHLKLHQNPSLTKVHTTPLHHYQVSLRHQLTSPPPKLRFVIPIKLEPQELLAPQISPNEPYAQTMDNWPLGPSNPSPPPRVSRPPLGFLNPPPGFEPFPSTQPLFVNINNNTPLLYNNAPPLENIHHPPPNLRNQDFPNPPNILDFVHPNDMPHLHNMFCQCYSTTRHEIQMLQNRVNYIYGYIKNHKKTIKNKQARTRERKSEQKPEAKPRKVKPSVKVVKSWSTEVNKIQNIPL
ncbi:hypothetical protein Tco_1032788 [Tanacetum coccineum]|uniref:Uncharacterized protein n=1 Tax=Tanacetum coccineum TaxID=301880 RepID=A0ABQ5GCT7_9ASTR